MSTGAQRPKVWAQEGVKDQLVARVLTGTICTLLDSEEPNCPGFFMPRRGGRQVYIPGEYLIIKRYSAKKGLMSQLISPIVP